MNLKQLAILCCSLGYLSWTVPDVMGADPARLTTLTNDSIQYRVSDEPFAILKQAGITAIVVDNSAVDNEHLDDHKAGYSGVATLSHTRQAENLFVPRYAGLNFEHIHDGTTRERDILFEPRKFPMQLRIINDQTVELHQPPTGNWKLESCTRYEILPDGTIQMTFECIPRESTYKNNYIGLFWASYIHQPESKEIHFRGVPRDNPQAEPAWITGVTPKHGEKPTHLGINDHRQFPHDEDFPLSLVFNRSDYLFTEPWYYAVSGKMAYILSFRDSDGIRLSQSPSGGGAGNPAWDFQWFIEQPEVGTTYSMVMRATYVPYESREQIAEIARRQVRELAGRDK